MVLLLWSSAAASQQAEDELGNWLIYNGTIQLSDAWSVFTEAQLRLYEVVTNPQETFVRAAGQYHFTPEALVALGYMRSVVWELEGSDRESAEHRIYEQFTIKHHWDRTIFEHRYRLEQRWIATDAGTRYTNRFRYRLQVTSPFNRPAMEKGAWFLNTYAEAFLNFDDGDTFDQIRLYAAGGYQFADTGNMQVGYLSQIREAAIFHRLQLFLTYNFDLR